jgi:ribonuclease BN (tRNA processing enzyme)
LIHPTAKEAAEMAKAAKVNSLALVHLGRYAFSIEMLSEAQAVFGGPIWIPDDLRYYTFGNPIHS